ncbi:EAL domain-containing protein [Photobacterium galatheae]|uniref:bifunctional diguanylate cyclase/phosphodiesterase n=1 Tax=Photobacterium galatheae TaxID=1654360 RepID=UPI00202CCE73|nr:EAL domain-containing protein [Photobacterium galatheae]MCM0148663.1 EAL domain-containing protein [Photobacterium galatheae]
MTLYRQIILWLLLVFLLLLVSVFYTQIHNTRTYLISQQSIDVDNAINAAGLALTPYLEDSDMIGAESVINAMFDGSFYQKVTLNIRTPATHIIREYPHDVSGVPEFFRRWLPINPISRTVTLTRGWIQTAELNITSSSAAAYQQLWRTANQLLLTLTTILGLGAGALLFGLNRIIRQPLNRLHTKALAISQNDFGAPLPLPATRELRDVVQAFNQMNTQLQQHFRQQAEETDRLRVQAYQDPVSGLANRRFLKSTLAALINSTHPGGLILLRSNSIEAAFQEQDFRTGDHLVVALAHQLQTLVAPKSTIGRLSQSEFLYIGPAHARQELIEIANRMLSMAQNLQNRPGNLSKPASVAAIVMKGDFPSVSDLLSMADNALNQADSQPEQPIAIIGHEDNLPAYGRQQWLSMVKKGIESGQFTFSYQTAMTHQHHPLFREVFASLSYQDQTFKAKQFLPALDNLGEGPLLDRYVLSQMVDALSADPTHDSVPLAVNLSLSSVTNAGFVRWLSELMASHHSLASHILFEIPEVAFVQYFEHTSLLCDIIRRHTFRFGIDHYGHHFSTLGHLQRFHPYYVKLDQAYTHQLDQGIKADVLRAITMTAENQHILTIATHVETKARLEALAALSVKGFQGYVVDSLLGESTP